MGRNSESQKPGPACTNALCLEGQDVLQGTQETRVAGAPTGQQLSCEMQLKDGQRETVQGFLVHTQCCLFASANYALFTHRAWAKKVFTFLNVVIKE